MDELYQALAALMGQHYQASAQDVPWESFLAGAYQAIDRRRGAPSEARLAASSARSLEDKLAAVRRYFPDAVPVNEKQFIYLDPETRRPTLFDEENPWYLPTGRDLLDAAPLVAEGVGGALGAAAGSPLGLGGAIGGAAAGAVAGREFQERTTRALYDVEDSRSVPRQVSDAFTTGLINAGGEGLGRHVGGGAKHVLSRRYGSGVREAADRLSVPLTAGEATGNRGIQLLERGAAASPAGQLTLDNFYTSQLDRLDEAVQAIGQRLGPAARTPNTRGAAASAIQEGAGRAVARYERQVGLLEDALEQSIGGDTLVPVNGAVRALMALRFGMQGAEESLQRQTAPSLQRLEALVRDASQNGGRIPFGALRQIRREIGELKGLSPAAGEYVSGSGQHLSGAYAALTEDLEAAVRSFGPAPAVTLDGGRSLSVEQLWELQQRYVRMARNGARDVNVQALGKLVQDKTPEQALNWALQGSGTSGGRLWSLRQAYEPETWDELASALWYDLGQASPGQAVSDGVEFSAARFLTNWNKMSGDARQALFSGTRYADVADDIDDLVRVVGALKQSGQMRNHSNTAQTLIAQSLLSTSILGGGGALATGSIRGAGGSVVLGIASPYAAAKVFQSRAFVRWLTEAVQATNASPTSWPAYAARAVLIAEQEPELAPFIYDRVVRPMDEYFQRRQSAR